MEEYRTLKYETNDRIGVLTLNRPEKLNAVNDEMRRELEAFWAERRIDTETRVIVMTGAGPKGFCAGMDIQEAFGQAAEYNVQAFYQAQARMSRVILAMRQAPQPIVAAVSGAAVGIGLCLALAADLRVIATNTRFGAAFINIGFGGADIGSSYFLPRLIGAGRAYEFLLTGDYIDAVTADRLGLVSRVAPVEEIMDQALELARKMCAKNPLGLRLTKEAINMNLDAAGLEQALNMEDRNQSLCFTTMRYEGYAMGA